ncbi:unnamed protein product [Closterium sp. NIES-54]
MDLERPASDGLLRLRAVPTTSTSNPGDTGPTTMEVEADNSKLAPAAPDNEERTTTPANGTGWGDLGPAVNPWREILIPEEVATIGGGCWGGPPLSDQYAPDTPEHLQELEEEEVTYEFFSKAAELPEPTEEALPPEQGPQLISVTGGKYLYRRVLMEGLPTSEWPKAASFPQPLITGNAVHSGDTDDIPKFPKESPPSNTSQDIPRLGNDGDDDVVEVTSLHDYGRLHYEKTNEIGLRILGLAVAVRHTSSKEPTTVHQALSGPDTVKQQPLHQIDVGSAFLYAPVDAIIFVEQPHAFEECDGAEGVARQVHPSRRLRRRSTGDDTELLDQFEVDIKEKLEMTINHNVTQFLGLNITQSATSIHLSAAKYAETLAKKFAVAPINLTTPYRTPPPNNKSDTTPLSIDDHRLYQQHLGCLLFVAVTASRSRQQQQRLRHTSTANRHDCQKTVTGDLECQQRRSGICAYRVFRRRGRQSLASLARASLLLPLIVCSTVLTSSPVSVAVVLEQEQGKVLAECAVELGATDYNWEPNAPCTTDEGLVCNADGTVNTIDLSGIGLQGSICSDIGNLTTLVTLDLSYNSLSGPIPASIGRLPLLKTLDLSYNVLEGALPSTIGSLSSLQTLNLYNNNFNGTVPASLSALISLKFLELGNNSFSGSFPTGFAKLTQLTLLSLFVNNFEGVVPSSISRLSKLQILNLGGNTNFEGEVLPAVATLSSLVVVLTNLQSVVLLYNQFTGSIPQTLSALKNLTHMDFAQNIFRGTIPSFFATLTKLDMLYVLL